MKISVHISKVFRELLLQEDTDQDKKITKMIMDPKDLFWLMKN
jgi:alpha,alpha-trehalase